jgi:hypothetical protein
MLCQLAENREAYAGESVTIEGYLLASQHGTVVSDPQCGYGIGLSWFEDDLPRLKKLESAAHRAKDGNVMARVRVTGEIKRDAIPGMAGEKAWRLDVAAADVLAERPLSPEDVERYLIWLEGPSSEPFRPIG